MIISRLKNTRSGEFDSSSALLHLGLLASSDSSSVDANGNLVFVLLCLRLEFTECFVGLVNVLAVATFHWLYCCCFTNY